MPGARCNTHILLTANSILKQNHHELLLEADPQAVQMFCKFWQDHADFPLVGRNLLLQSVCPQLQGLCMVKLALMLMLIGGEQQISKSGSQTRAELHMLLVGDPGTGKSSASGQYQNSLHCSQGASNIFVKSFFFLCVGKSQLMQYAAKLSPRAVVSSGRGSSSAGLTVTAIKDAGQWALEAGALVLADGQLVK